MRKIMFLLLLLMLIPLIAGCNDERVTFSGESENWEGQYTATIDGSSENGKYTFKFKNASEGIIFENLNIKIDDSTEVNRNNYKRAIIEIDIGCSGCSVTDADQPIQATIKWDGNEETLSMEP